MNKLKELTNTTKLVKIILEQDFRARSSDYFLYLKVIEYQAAERGIDLTNISVPVFLMRSAEWKFSPFETVRRTRQKIQAEFPELAACEQVEDFRTENEQAFREYSRG